MLPCSPAAPALVPDMYLRICTASALQYVNPTDYFMSVLKEKGDELVLAWEKQEQQGRACGLDLEAPPPSSASLEAAAGAKGAQEEPAKLQVAPKVPWWYQVWVLSGRMMRMWWRNPAMVSEGGVGGPASPLCHDRPGWRLPLLAPRRDQHMPGCRPLLRVLSSS